MHVRIAIAGLLANSLIMAADLSTSAPVTFSKDVLPILQKNCQTCHRPGQMGPMSFLTYESARPWAKAMKAAVVTRATKWTALLRLIRAFMICAPAVVQTRLTRRGHQNHSP